MMTTTSPTAQASPLSPLLPAEGERLSGCCGAAWMHPGVFHPRTPEDIFGQKMEGLDV